MTSKKNTFIRSSVNLLAVAVMGVAMVSLAGCGDKKDDGVAAEAGHELDKLTDNQGPAEKAGDKVDNAIDSLKD